ncbi:uncharacterized protein LOC133308541 [Gastrolobium bilobum]|uniref:uncharacterized protein LOC133308541 n=1 Tax=Gastrolobium bilobum TaxID=150636 RepID=UPI002AB1FB83|nr:uncharacterized protein LOC133308541 [Gastrolobium bilobum]
MGSSASKRVKNCLSNSTQFDSACDSAFSHCLSLTQHAFEGVFPYQLNTASDHIHNLISKSNAPQPLIQKWVPTPPDRSQVDSALRRVTSPDQILGPVVFKAWALQLYTEAVLSGAGKAVMVRVPVGVAGIVGIGALTRPSPQLLGTFVGAYSLGVALSIFLGLSA